MVRLRRVCFPQTYKAVRAATGEEAPSRTPLNLLDFEGVAARPHLHRILWLRNLPQVDVLAFTSDGHRLIILPIDFDALQVGVQLRVH